MKIHVVVSWVLIPCNDVVEYQGFGGPHELHFQGEVNGKGNGAQSRTTPRSFPTATITTHPHFLLAPAYSYAPFAGLTGLAYI
jgi:hypothetical protein